MPLNYDLADTRRRRGLHPLHVRVASEYLLLLRRQSHWDRPHAPVVNDLAEDDLTHDAIVLWALVREEIKGHVVHDCFCHRDSAYASHGAEREHAHMAPLLVDILKNNILPRALKAGRMVVDREAYERARRDLDGLIGMRLAAGRAKLDPDAVFRRVRS